ncbi:shikimate dehydrogenase family protein [Sphingosinicella terrae]|uniref:shikimate dehydrogenase family protein n=1 Tax=Sphingosinicella terrae TaxID=2172047 RepID=UPI000E0DB9D6|nr:shikimate dehydrogenase [Sphingosinicella terrae]
MAPYAEVIGDPIAHSKSPAIHGFWLGALGLDHDYRATRVTTDELQAFFAARAGDDEWRGCNVTAPHKQAVMPFLDEISADATRIGAVNCIHRAGGRLIGLNTDVDGIAEALDAAAVEGGKAAVIGAGGGARAAIRYLAGRSAAEIVVLARRPERATDLLSLGDEAEQVRILTLDRVSEALSDATAIIQATPAGMAHAEPLPAPALAALGEAAPGAVALDMVYQPLNTPFLEAAEAAGLVPVDGLNMLIGQARKAFELFFGAVPPQDQDEELRAQLDG